MSLWETFGTGFQDENPIRNIRKIRKIYLDREQESNSANIANIAHILSSPNPATGLGPEKAAKNGPSPCRNLPFIPAMLDGFPCCWLYDDDLQGMGIPAGGLPAALRGFSLNGWRLDFDAGGKVKMYPGQRTRWEQGCRQYLEANYENIAAGLRAFNTYRASYGLK